jgi:hypothetical protein
MNIYGKILARVDRLASIVASLLMPPPRVIRVGSGIRVTIDRPSGSSRRVIRATFEDDWRRWVEVLEARILDQSLSIQGWTVDFGDDGPAEQLPQAEDIVVRHDYSPGYHVVRVTARVAGQEEVPISLPYAHGMEVGQDPVVLEFSGLATLLVER